MTKIATVLMTLLGTAFAQIDRTCIDIAFNSETNTLSGKCQPRDNSGYIPSELDLNDCFGYDGTTITSEKVAVPLVTLDLLPPEVLLQISGEPGRDQDTISAEEFKGLSWLSPPLNQVYLPFHYSGNNNGVFRQALRSANVKAMERCAQLGAATYMRWELLESNGCQCISEYRHTHHRPIDELLECLYFGETPIGQFEVTYEELPHPLMQRWAGNCRFEGPQPLHFGGEVVETADKPWWKLNNVLYTVWGLFLDLMDNSTAWAEEYPNEAADVFEKKVEILIDNGVVRDSDSQRCWEALYSAIIPFKNIEEHWVLDDWDLNDPTVSLGLPRECHRFHADPEYNGYKMYHDYQMQTTRSD
ncbi:hypothetical protein FACUT_97 [Fusarium acutatum]|uniref:Cyanovirin-N domain-containing protein n=1 Tax=Fusarium acutatum TaxID=78861 RepID=A0A8H4NRQ8_9HYPO|nr:hypothetical protein FACUT_97 [Fusarium acutatum]